MVEVPSAALQAEQLAATADFFSIGTNDLTQYTMAAERGNELVGGAARRPATGGPAAGAATIAGAEAHGRWVGVCGELAGDPAAAVLLVGLGVRELSMAPPLVPEVKAALRSVTLADRHRRARRALDARDSRPGTPVCRRSSALIPLVAIAITVEAGALRTGSHRQRASQRSDSRRHERSDRGHAGGDGPRARPFLDRCGDRVPRRSRAPTGSTAGSPAAGTSARASGRSSTRPPTSSWSRAR